MPVAGECSAATPSACGSISRSPSAVEAAQARHAVLACRATRARRGPGSPSRSSGDDHLAAALDRHVVALAERVQVAGALDAEPRLQRAGRVVDAGVDDARVVAGLVRADALLALDDVHAQVGVAQQRLAGDGEPEDPGADDDEVAGRVAHAAILSRAMAVAQRVGDRRLAVRRRHRAAARAPRRRAPGRSAPSSATARPICSSLRAICTWWSSTCSPLPRRRGSTSGRRPLRSAAPMIPDPEWQTTKLARPAAASTWAGVEPRDRLVVRGRVARVPGLGDHRAGQQAGGDGVVDGAQQAVERLVAGADGDERALARSSPRWICSQSAGRHSDRAAVARGGLRPTGRGPRSARRLMTRPDMLASPTRAVVSMNTIRAPGEPREHAERHDEARAGGDDDRRAQVAQHADRAREVRQHA